MMKLYHGSNVEVREPRILEPSHALDFGPGFYTTLNRDQAVDFAGNQLVFATPMALAFIRFVKSEVVA